MSKHVHQAHDSKRVECRTAGKLVGNKITHVDCMHEEEQTKCYKRDELFVNMNHLKVHLRKHASQADYHCQTMEWVSVTM